MSGPVPIIKPIGIGWLEIVKKRLVRYEAGEVAHIENVMAHERRHREHRRLRQTETVSVDEMELIEESSLDSQSTERFEIEGEVSEVLQSETKMSAGVDVSASYGTVKVDAFGRVSTSTSREQSSRQATSYAKEITERARERVERKIKNSRTTRELVETEETNTHGFDPSEENNVGVYRWVDKYYRAKVVSYGKRLMYEFVVPEPAAFYIYALNANSARELPERPELPEIDVGKGLKSPAEINEENYLIPLAQYRVQGVKPPPPKSIVVNKHFSAEVDGGPYVFSDDGFRIPDGYVAERYWLNYHTWAQTIADSYFHCFVGPAIGPSPQTGGLAGHAGEFPISFIGNGQRVNFVTVDLHCRRTNEAFAAWQLETYNAIMSAYQKALIDYEDELAAMSIEAGISVDGDNPDINRNIEREELKKACITLWTGDHFGYDERLQPRRIRTMNGERIVRRDPPMVVSPWEEDAYRAAPWDRRFWDGDTLRFLESAFEWKNMTYEFLPYYWGLTTSWVEKFGLRSTDPIFEKFLQAGAAIVRVPVHLEWTASVLYYQLTGQVWKGTKPPIIDDEGPEGSLYRDYMVEIDSWREGEEVAAIRDEHEHVQIEESDPDSWEMKVPTRLVWLQSENSEGQLPTL